MGQPIPTEQHSLLGPVEEASLYHSIDGFGFFSLNTRRPGEEMQQTSYKLDQLPSVLESIDPESDTWISQAEFFKPNRQVVNLLRINMLFVDLDTYREPWAYGRTPDQLVESIKYYCAADGIPIPSLFNFSGRGVQVKWLLDGPLPRRALPRWNACQRHLINRLLFLGADKIAKDGSRILRVVNTVNTKSNKECKVVQIESDGAGSPIRYNFDYLCEILLPTDRSTIEDSRRNRKQDKNFRCIPGNKPNGIRPLSSRQLAWDRLEDLRKLISMRGTVPVGERMLFLFWMINFLWLSGATNSNKMYQEACVLANEIDPSWSYREKELKTLHEKGKAYEYGEKVDFLGKKYNPLYTPKNSTLIDTFGVSHDEQLQLKTIISKDLSKERKRTRDRKNSEERRRNAGSINREFYEEHARKHYHEVMKLKEEGLSLRDIAEQIGISKSKVSYLLR